MKGKNWELCKDNTIGGWKTDKSRVIENGRSNNGFFGNIFGRKQAQSGNRAGQRTQVIKIEGMLMAASIEGPNMISVETIIDGNIGAASAGNTLECKGMIGQAQAGNVIAMSGR